jgi:hypothetical protein
MMPLLPPLETSDRPPLRAAYGAWALEISACCHAPTRLLDTERGYATPRQCKACGKRCRTTVGRWDPELVVEAIQNPEFARALLQPNVTFGEKAVPSEVIIPLMDQPEHHRRSVPKKKRPPPNRSLTLDIFDTDHV